ncbi:hypothetical protein Syun_004429 [Stephania yunnanensis]|uniref:Uncharacterized protein n=1 Tax=Stephania yunnanensis TaxID=152371 RepID=A0AAP0L309_9MAGN
MTTRHRAAAPRRSQRRSRSRAVARYPPNNPKSHSSRSPQNPQIPSRLALSLSGSRLRSVARVGDSATPPSRPSCDQNPKSLLVSLSALRPRLRSVARVARRLRPTPPSRPSCDQNPQIPSRLALLSGSRPAECGARGSATPAYAPPSRPSRLAIVLGSFMGTDDSKSRARLGSALGFELSSSTRPVSLSFSDLLRLRLASRFVYLRYMAMMCISLWRISVLGWLMGLKLKLSAKIRIQSWIPVFSAIDRWSFVVFQIAAHSLLFVEMWICHEK